MRCIEITKPGGPSVLREGSRPRPVPNKDEVLVKVSAAGINRPDVLQRQGLYPPPDSASDLLGLEIAGEVIEVGDNVSSFAKGDRICGLSPGGGYAQYCAIPALQCLRIPDGLNMAEAAALPETFFTVWYNLFMKGGLREGQTLLIHGGSSGIGTTAIQIAKAFAISTFITAGSDEKCTACSELGADVTINYRKQPFEKVIAEHTGGKGVDIILDMVGGDYIQRNILSLAQNGRLINLYYLKGSTVEVDMMPVLLKGLTLTGSVLRPQPLSVKAQIRDELLDQVWPHIEAGKIKPIIYKAFPLHKANEAHALMESSRHIGKIVLVNED